jgi:CMP-N,N'-diacetyllegionaminic acid synthase
MSRTTALILARGGSKGLPGKNIKLLLGKPLIQYSIEAALWCPLIDEVYVSTDDPQIASISQSVGALLPPLRPTELATDTASSMDVVRYFLNWYQQTFFEKPENLVLLQPTSPLRNAKHLEEAMALYLANTKSTVVSVNPAKPLAWQGTVDKLTHGFNTHQLTNLSSNRQTETANYILNGAIYVAPTHKFEKDTLLSERPVQAYVMPPEASVDIDTLMDFKLAELLLQEQRFAAEISAVAALESV